MDASVVAVSWTTAQRKEKALHLYGELSEAKAWICKKFCSSSHCELCDQLTAALLDAEPVLTDWSLE